MRRLFLKSIMAGLLAFCGLTTGLPVMAEEPIKVVYDLAEGNEQATRALANIRNHLKAEPGTRIAVVTHGDGIKFLLDGAQDANGRKYEGAIAALALAGVEFKVCNNTLTAHKISPDAVVMEARIVPSGVAEVARLQAREGYVYIHP